MSKGTLHLIPCTISESDWQRSIPTYVRELALGIKYFVVEKERESRRFLKRLDKTVDIDLIQFDVLPRRGETADYSQMLAPALSGQDIGLMTDAGCPGVADPGEPLVQSAHEKGIRVVPHIGPSSILLTLMASGMNGQAFAFNGYLPKDRKERIRALKKMEDLALKGTTQLFMDTPYRNVQVLEDILNHCRPASRLTIAANITSNNEDIRCMTIAEWKGQKMELNKIPVMMALGV